MLVLTTLNSQYVHSNLALKYLSGVASDVKIPHVTMEFTINDDIDNLIRRICRANPDVVAFSCYIWNIESTLKVMQTIKLILPQVVILAGGPEVSFDSVQIMTDYPCIDLIINGEGEQTFREYLVFYQNGLSFNSIDGLTWRDGATIIENPPRKLVGDIQQLPMAYGRQPLTLDDRILYYETSRGCPFSCSYCLSSTTKGVRFFSIERVKTEIYNLVQYNPRQIKFVDRSFNCHPSRALELMSFMAELPGQTNFHFEIVADLLTDEMLEFLVHVPKGRFQFEIGIQSINPETLASINRTTDLEKTAQNIGVLKEAGNIHIHLDLITGLPHEDFESLTKSFNWVYELHPDYLQLGFLKMLKGSEIREKAPEYGYLYKNYPPYEVLENQWLNYQQISRLKIIDQMVGKYYNSGVFRHTLEYCMKHQFNRNAMSFFADLADFWVFKHYDEKPVRRDKLYGILAEYLTSFDHLQQMIYSQLLMFDFVYFNPNLDIPVELNREKIQDQASLIKQYLRDASYSGAYTRIEVFRIDILFLAGINSERTDRPYYPVLFYRGDDTVTTRYIQLRGEMIDTKTGIDYWT